MLLPTLFPGFTLLAGPKHSTSVSSSAEVAVPLSVDEKVGPLVPNPVPDLAMKVSPGPQIEEEADLCGREQSLLPATLQIVNPFMSPPAVHLKVKVSPGQMGRAAVNCPATPSGEKWHNSLHWVLSSCPKTQSKLASEKFGILHTACRI